MYIHIIEKIHSYSLRIETYYMAPNAKFFPSSAVSLLLCKGSLKSYSPKWIVTIVMRILRPFLVILSQNCGSDGHFDVLNMSKS